MNSGAALVERARVRFEKDKLFRARVESAYGERALQHGFMFYSTGDSALLFPLFAFALLEKGRVSKEDIRQFVAAKFEHLESFQAVLAKPLRELLAAIEQ